MPNWTSNVLVVEGDEKILKKFSVFAKNRIKYENDKEEDLFIDFNKFIPYPEEFKHLDNLNNLNPKEKNEYLKANKVGAEMIKKLMLCNLTEKSAEDWLGWHTQNWGTKWNSCYGKFKKYDKNVFVYQFDTAWSPPLGVLNAMNIQFPELTFTLLYGEEGMFFSGFIRIQKDKVIENKHGKFKRNWMFPERLMKKYGLTKLDKIIFEP